MKIRYVHGNLLEAAEPYILHGCNAQGVMGSGVAAQIRARNPEVYEEYRRVYEEQGNLLHLGQTIWVRASDYTFINGITQEFYGRDKNVVYVSYDAVRKVIENIDLMASTFQAWKVEAVALPLIGAGLANGDWKIISEIIEEGSINFEPVVYLYDGKMPGE